MDGSGSPPSINGQEVGVNSLKLQGQFIPNKVPPHFISPLMSQTESNSGATTTITVFPTGTTTVSIIPISG